MEEIIPSKWTRSSLAWIGFGTFEMMGEDAINGDRQVIGLGRRWPGHGFVEYSGKCSNFQGVSVYLAKARGDDNESAVSRRGAQRHDGDRPTHDRPSSSVRPGLARISSPGGSIRQVDGAKALRSATPSRAARYQTHAVASNTERLSFCELNPRQQARLPTSSGCWRNAEMAIILAVSRPQAEVLKPS